MTRAAWLIQVGGERGRALREAIGTDVLPVTTPVPMLARIGDEEPSPVYFVKLDELDAPTRAGLVRRLAARPGFTLTVAEIEAAVARSGLAVRAESTRLAIDWRCVL